MDNKHTVDKALEYIESHLDENMSLDDIAKHTGYSKFHLNRMFAEQVGCPLQRYIHERRLSNAGEQLVATELPIIDIAHQSGYGSQQAFTLAFRRQYHCTPQVYRNTGVHRALRGHPSCLRHSTGLQARCAA